MLNNSLIICLFLLYGLPCISDAQRILAMPAWSTGNVFARLTFSWLDGLLDTGYTRALQLGDVPELPSEATCESVSENFQVCSFSSSEK